jgi:beta-mannanase
MRSTRYHIAAVLVFVSLSVTGALLMPLSTSASTPLPQTASPATGIGVTHGIHLRPVAITDPDGSYHGYGQEIDAFGNLVGKNVGVVMYFTDWAKFDPFLSDAVSAYFPASRRPIIVLSWEPGSSSAGCDLGYGDGLGPVRSIVQGRCDNYIRSFAQTLKARPERYLLRLAHEMNITDSPWGAGRYGNTPGDYVAMWRRVHDIFTAVGVPNVEWVWSPNNISNPLETWNTLDAYYPGDGYVDWIGLSGFNWYQRGGQPWRSFTDLYDAVLKDLACRFAKPQILAEWGSVDGGTSETSKAAWVSDAYKQILKYPFVRAVIWFNDYAAGNRSQADFRVTTGTADCASGGGCSGVQPLPGAGAGITRAYIQAVADPGYTSPLPTLAAATPASTQCGNGPIFGVAPQTLFAVSGSGVDVKVSGAQLTTPVTIGVQVPSTFKATLSSQLLSPPLDSAALRLTALTGTSLGMHTVVVQVGDVKLDVKVNVVSVIRRVYLPLARR